LPQRPAAQEPIPQLASSSAGLPAALALPPDVSDALHCLAGQRPRVHSPGALAGTERKALESLDQTLALPTLPEDLLPRAAALILPLLALLRQTDLPVPALAERVSWDVLLTAEVLRVVSSPYDRAQGALTSLAQAIPLTGIQGRQAVFARVVLKPMCEAPPGPLSAHAASRLWDHAEALARHSARLAGQAGLRMSDGCPAGLLHGSGWTITLRVLGRAGFTPPLHRRRILSTRAASAPQQRLTAAPSAAEPSPTGCA